VFNVLISTFQSYESDGAAKMLYISIDNVFGLNMASKHCSEFPEFINGLLFCEEFVVGTKSKILNSV
jgi:hypothetical protein